MRLDWQARQQTGSRTELQARLFDGYVPIPGTYDELFEAPGRPRPHAAGVLRNLEMLSGEAFAQRQALAELSLYNQGVTFSVYSDKQGTEKIFPICLVPRVIAASDWTRVERGLAQRMAALCTFLDDMYGEQTHPGRRRDPGGPGAGRQVVRPEAARPARRRAACASPSPAST